MKNVTSFFLTLLLISCHHKNEKITKTTENKTSDPLHIVDPIDIKKIEEDRVVTIDTTLFCVYDLSKKTIAIAANLEEEGKTEFDKIFNQVNAKDSLYNVLSYDNNKIQNFEYYDTLGSFKLIRNKLLEREIKKIIHESYYVYGTKGFSKVTINKVVCALNECRTNFIAFPIENFNTAKNGKAIFCSKQLLKLNYQKSYFQIEKKIREYDKIQSKNYDYNDEIKTKVFANIGDYYFTYNDDFLWGRYPEKTECKFPTRSIYILKKDKPIKKLWADGLDLFGIPCD